MKRAALREGGAKILSSLFMVTLIFLFLVGFGQQVYACDKPDCPDTCIELTKTGPKSADPGETISYDFIVKNCGNVELASGAWVEDYFFDPARIWYGDLMPDESVEISMEYTVDEKDCGLLTNVAKATGVPVDGSDKVYDEATWTVKVDCSPGTGSPGYWKNQPDAWPVDEIAFQCDSDDMTFDQEKAIDIMKKSGKGDKCFTMFRALTSAKLNVEIGNMDYCVERTISNAECWMVDNCMGFAMDGKKTVRGSSKAWRKGEPMYWKLDDYNNGKLCAPHRD